MKFTKDELETLSKLCFEKAFDIQDSLGRRLRLYENYQENKKIQKLIDELVEKHVADWDFLMGLGFKTEQKEK